MAQVKHIPSSDSWRVRWKEPVVIFDAPSSKYTWEEIATPEGPAWKRWKDRSKTFSSKADAQTYAREVELAASRGERVQDERMQAVSTIGGLRDAYLQASKSRPQGTQRTRASLLRRFIEWAGEERPMRDLTSGLLHEYVTHLEADGIKSRSRYVGAVEQLWKWAHNKGDTYPGIPAPRKITGADNDVPHDTAPVATDNPTWADVEALLHALTPEGAPQGQGKGYGYRPQWRLHRRVALAQAYTGLRVSQLLSLTWDDLDLDRGRLSIRAGMTGAKGQRQDRVVPLHPALVEELATWGRREGPVFGRIATKGKRRGQVVVPRGDEIAEVFTGAWKRAEVSPSKWADVGERDKGRPTNAIRARWKSSVAGASSYDLATMMVGQSAGKGEHDAYVAMGNPEASPYWDAMVQALECIPVLGGEPVKVHRLRAAR